MHSDILSYTDVIGVHPQGQGMNRRVTARSSRQRVDAEPTIETTTSPVQMSFADFQKDFNRAYNQFYLSRRIDADLKRKVSEFDITIPEFEKLTLNKQYQRYITLEEGKIRFDEIPMRPHGEIVGLLNSVIARQVEGADYADGLECASDNGMLFVNSPNGHRLQVE